MLNRDAVVGFTGECKGSSGIAVRVDDAERTALVQ